MFSLFSHFKRYTYTLLILFPLFFCAFPSLAIQKDKIIVGTDTWFEYAEEDGSGIYLELLYEIYGRENIEVQFMPFKRVIDSFNKGKVDIVIGMFRDDIDNGLFPNWYLDVEYPVSVLYRSDAPKITKALDLNDLSVGWLRGYEFGRYIPEVKRIYELSTLTTGFDMLVNKRLDVVIDYAYNIPERYKNQITSYDLIPERYIFSVFQKNLHGKKLKEQYDLKMSELRDNGFLKKLFKKEYGHTAFEHFNPNKKTILMFTDEAGVFYKQKKSSVELSNRLASSLHFIFEQLPNYHIEYKLLSDFSHINEYAKQESICFSDMIKTPQREQHFIYSNPVTLYLGMELHSIKPLDIDVPIKLDQLEQSLDNYMLGVVNGRSYGSEVDLQLKKINRLNLIDVSAEVDISTKMLASHKFDLLVEYPHDIHYYWTKYTHSTLYSYPIEGAPKYILGHFMCSKTPSGEQFVQDVNQILDKFNRNNTLLNIQQRFIHESHKALFEKYFDLGVKRNEVH